MHVWNEAVNADLQKHDQSPAHILPHFTVLVTSQGKQTLVGRKGKGEKLKRSNKVKQCELYDNDGRKTC